MVYIKNSIFLSACEGCGLIYACAPAAFQFIAGATNTRGGALSWRFGSHFGAHKCILEGFQVVCMLLMVIREKCELTFPFIGGSASVYALFPQ